MLSVVCKHSWPRLLLAVKDSRTLAQAHALIILTGLLVQPKFAARLIAAYGRSGNMSAARVVFDEIPQPTISDWNALIVAHSRNDLSDEVLLLYRRMVSNGRVRPDSSSFTVALKACAKIPDVEAAEEIRSHAFSLGYGADVFVSSSLVNLYAKCGKMDAAMKVFERMPKRDLVLWTTMITGLACAGMPLEAICLYGNMRSEGVEGDEITMVGLLQACAGMGNLMLGRSVHGYMIRLGMKMGVVVETSLVGMYAKSGCLSLASIIFERMQYKNVISWSTLISDYAQHGHSSEALVMMTKMQDCGLEPDSVALVSALLACSHFGYLKLGKSAHGFMVRKNFQFGRILGTALVDMYSKCGSLSSARACFDMLCSRDLISWNVIIACYGIHGNGKGALSLFLEMKETELRPDDATFVSLLTAFGHSGLVEDGRWWFNSMMNDFGIEPMEKHYACLIDLLARAGHIEEALNLIKSMPIEPGIEIWVSLLSGCYNHKKLDLGEFAAEKVLKLNPVDLGVYALASNMYALARNWDKVQELRVLMKTMGKKKTPGCSLVEVNGELHTFLADDERHTEYVKVMAMLERLECEMTESCI
ncbi:hypothetical protein HPP92_021425 [Vanilla planifolia]|uniref:Pentatricopeptide repeat-containing protein n=1 Tax=Vanilla planifolia TaxID=51239 RepID=A0A835PY45_VANPL|nr:hypothetical protein HPP92_021425 [Vanilla planifolia]